MKTKLKTVENVRELGGTECRGRKVAPGRLYRGGHLGDMSAKDADTLVKKLGINTVFDLRHARERENKPDPELPGVTLYAVSALPESAESDEREKRIIGNMMNFDGDADAILCDLYVRLVTHPDSLAAYRRFFDVLLSCESGAVYWHCSQGKDRAGIAAASVLFALGASRETVLQEYMLTNELLKKKLKKIARVVRVRTGSEKKVHAALSLAGAREEFMLAAFDAMDKNYGSPLGFLRQGLKLTDDEIQRLCELYLV